MIPESLDAYIPFEDRKWLNACVNRARAHIRHGCGDLFHDESIEKMLWDEVETVALPMFMVKSIGANVLNSHKSLALPSDDHLIDVLLCRLSFLEKFLVTAARAVRQSQGGPGGAGPGGGAVWDRKIDIAFLSGDSHNKGQRPIVFGSHGGQFVLKFSEPRTYHVLTAVLRMVSEHCGTDVEPPPILQDPHNIWYMRPYLTTGEPAGEGGIRLFMRRLGMVTCAAYCLKMIDVHHENIIVSNGKPVIIDTECIFYDVDSMPGDTQLLNTGLVGRQVLLSGIRGGGDLFMLRKNVGDDGTLNYQVRQNTSDNKIHDVHGNPVDATHYTGDIVAGFMAAYDSFLANRSRLGGMVREHVAPDMRIRYIMRKTRQYLMAIEMLNHPCHHRETVDSRRKRIFGKLSEAGQLSPVISKKIFAQECQDLENRDIPYFHYKAGQTGIYHRTGKVGRLPAARPVLSSLAGSFFSFLSETDGQARVDELRRFLEADAASDWVGTKTEGALNA